MPLRPIVLTALLLCGPALAEELTPKRLAEIQHAEEAALKKVAAEFGNKKPSELSSSERRAFIEKQNAALKEVHAEQKVDAKTYARTLAKQTRAERQAFTEAKEALQDAEKGGTQPGEVEIIGAEKPAEPSSKEGKMIEIPE